MMLERGREREKEENCTKFHKSQNVERSSNISLGKIK